MEEASERWGRPRRRAPRPRSRPAERTVLALTSSESVTLAHEASWVPGASGRTTNWHLLVGMSSHGIFSIVPHSSVVPLSCVSRAATKFAIAVSASWASFAATVFPFFVISWVLMRIAKFAAILPAAERSILGQLLRVRLGLLDLGRELWDHFLPVGEGHVSLESLQVATVRALLLVRLLAHAMVYQILDHVFDLVDATTEMCRDLLGEALDGLRLSSFSRGT